MVHSTSALALVPSNLQKLVQSQSPGPQHSELHMLQVLDEVWNLPMHYALEKSDVRRHVALVAGGWWCVTRTVLLFYCKILSSSLCSSVSVRVQQIFTPFTPSSGSWTLYTVLYRLVAATISLSVLARANLERCWTSKRS